MSSEDTDPLSQTRLGITTQLDEITRSLQEQVAQNKACLEKMKETEAEKEKRRKEKPDVYGELTKGLEAMIKLREDSKGEGYNQGVWMADTTR